MLAVPATAAGPAAAGESIRRHARERILETGTVRARIEKSAHLPVPLCPGGRIDYGVVLTNLSDPDTGLLPASIHDPIPAGTSYAGGLAGGAGYDPAAGAVTWNGVLAPGQSHTISFSVTVDAGRTDGTAVVNRATGVLGQLPVAVDLPATVDCGPRPIPGEEIFTDGFESGDTSAWSDQIGGLPPLSAEHRRAGETLCSQVSVPSTSEILVFGPVAPGTRISEQTWDLAANVLQVPVGPGRYYAFFIDDRPGFKYGHPVRYAWLDAETGEFEAIDAAWRPTLVQPGVPPSPFVSTGTGVLSCDGPEGESFVRTRSGKGSGAGTVNDTTHKPEARPPAYDPGEWIKVALVIDLGDVDDDSDAEDLAETMAEDADAVAGFLRQNGFTVQRISQYWGNRHPKLEPGDMAGHLTEILEGYADVLQCIPTERPDCCHEFFLYVGGHSFVDGRGQPIDTLALYEASGNGTTESFRYAALRDALAQLEDCVKPIVFLDSCYSGRLVPILTADGDGDGTPDLCEGRSCGMTILTATDATHPAAGGTGLTDSATQDFMEDAGDLDGDGKSNDLGDRWRNMDEEGGDYDPQLFMCPGQTRLCSTD